MRTKKVQITSKPTAKQVPPSPDEWVSRSDDALAEREKMRRITIDIPEDLHKKIKVFCAINGTTVADEVRKLLGEKFGGFSVPSAPGNGGK